MIFFCACGSEGDSAEIQNNDPIEDGADIEPENNENNNVEFTTVSNNAKIIRTIKIYGETKNFTNATQTVKDKLYAAGGYVETSEITGGESLYNGSKTAKKAVYILRIPTPQVDSYVETLQTLLNVTSYTEKTKDVSLDYYDLESRIKILETKKQSIEELLENAKTVHDIKTYQDELFEVISEIETLKSKLNVYDNKVNYSTIGLSITEVIEYTETTESDKGFGSKLSDTFSGSWKTMGTFLEYLVIFLVAAFPILLFLGVIAFIVILIVRLVKRSKRNKNDQLK